MKLKKEKVFQIDLKMIIIYTNAFGSVDFFNVGLDKKGNLHVKVYDTYDFNPEKKINL